MPYIDQGTLGQWLASNPKPWEVQSCFRQLVQVRVKPNVALIVLLEHDSLQTSATAFFFFSNKLNPLVPAFLSFQGLAYMHDNGIVHRDIKMDNILMTADLRPVICDFGISHEEGGTASTGSTRDERTTGGGGYAPAGTEGYIAPEVLKGKRATAAADMWAIGVLLCKAYLGCEPAVTADGVVVPLRFPGEPVQALVEGCLRTSPDERLTAHEALANSFFAVATFSRAAVTGKQLLGSEVRIDLVRRQARLLRRPGAFALHVRRAALVADAIEAFNSISMDTATLTQPFHVHFIGEPAVGGGLVSDFYASFFSGLSSALLFDEGGLPRSGCEDLASFRVVGNLLGRCIVDRCSVGQFGATSLFKFLLGQEPGLPDLEIFDGNLAIGLRNLMLCPVAEGTDLFFADGTRVSDANKQAFVDERVQHVLVGLRRKALEAVKSGFEEALGSLTEALSVFSSTELQLLMCGESHIDGHMVASALRFSGWASSSSTPGHLVEMLLEMTPQELRRFLLLGTSSCALPVGGGGSGFLTIQRCPASERLPVGRTCFRRVDLPEYEDKELLRTKLMMALANLDEAFTLL
jgi:hypothetical protein